MTARDALRRPLQIALGLGVSALFVWLSLRGTHLREVGEAIARADLRYLALYAVFLLGVHLMRAVRWGVLLEPLARIGFRQLNAFSAVGFMALMILPLRLGELARPVLVAEHLKVKKSAALASVVVERMLDGLAIGLLLVTLLWTLGPEATGGAKLAGIRTGGVLATLGFGCGLVVLVLAFVLRERAVVLVKRVLRFAPRLAERVAGMLAAFTDGLRVVPSSRKLGEILLLTAIYWGISGFGLLAVAPAFGFTLTPLQAFTVLGLQVLGAMIPAGPGMVGTLQFFTALGLGLFIQGDGAAAQAAAYAHTVWAMQFGAQVLLGMLFLATGEVRLGGLLDGLALRRAPSVAQPHAEP